MTAEQQQTIETLAHAEALIESQAKTIERQKAIIERQSKTLRDDSLEIRKMTLRDLIRDQIERGDGPRAVMDALRETLEDMYNKCSDPLIENFLHTQVDKAYDIEEDYFSDECLSELRSLRSQRDY